MSTWLGNSDNRLLTGASSNSSLPGDIIRPVMEYAHKEIYAAENKWKPGDWLQEPEGIQKINGELFPSWYNKDKAQKQDKRTFDKVSKKLATDCTPAAARVEVGVTVLTDPITEKKKIVAWDGYDASGEDDVHSCNDAKPSVTLTPRNNGRRLTVSYTTGKFSLQNVRVTVNGTEIANFGASSSGSRTIANTADYGDNFTATATVQDEGYYSSQTTVRWSD
jgi:penicillin-binding protein 1A